MNPSPRVRARTVKTWLCALLLALAPVTLPAAPVCVVPEGGIGGTGRSIDGGGIGGTGRSADAGGIGGTGRSADGGGIGGTGVVASPSGGGIGGTGAPQAQPQGGGIGGTGHQAQNSGGTGILGVITGFASVCVNGLEVHLDDTTPVTGNSLPARADRLAVGQVIAVDAGDSSRGLVAKSIGIMNALEGPVTRVQADSGILYVMNQKVRVDDETRVNGFSSVAEVAPGWPLRVSGYRNAGNEVIASRIDLVRDLQGASVIGPLVAGGASGPAVGGVPIRSNTGDLQAGAEVLVRGTWDGRALDARSIERDPSLRFLERAERVVVEGIVQVNRGGQLKIDGFDVIPAGATSVGDASEGTRVRISGKLQPGRRLEASHIDLLRSPAMGESGKKQAMGTGEQKMQSGAPMNPELMRPMERPQRMTPIMRPDSMHH